jgi:hypothetical protein
MQLYWHRNVYFIVSPKLNTFHTFGLAGEGYAGHFASRGPRDALPSSIATMVGAARGEGAHPEPLRVAEFRHAGMYFDMQLYNVDTQVYIVDMQVYTVEC